MSKPNLILIGAGGHARACIEVIEQHGKYQIAGLVGRQEEMHTRHLGYSVIATDADLAELAKEYQYGFITLGQIRSPDSRIRLFSRTKELGFQLPVVIAPTAHVSRHATIGTGTTIMHGATLNGGVRIGAGSFVGSGSVIKEGVSIGKWCLVGMGLSVRHNQGDHARYVGEQKHD
jgi:UDP-3-O-[3-hydroxymyristoyl] glucosamine N-acyltransferase